ncbi:energy-coupling factor transport system substrate-specific component [Kineococcus xinjiangensis]|uniref:Energy-coupling factor transport system substrate-specific component n=1 Tax=Kineococcus xinjiangensis TaxID=512762 RepID=A0A2S6IV07_9ACTN|nr:ECF transporter S component [Kineococcus xinjiangensis]PPK98019.1 energy-coupling factor transport system substrate-specific component [Kineococcus xinjiangensis]
MTTPSPDPTRTDALQPHGHVVEGAVVSRAAGTPTAAPVAGSVPARRPLMRWRSIDLITAAMLGVVFGVMFWGWNNLFYVIQPGWAAFPPAGGLVSGMWLLPAVVGALVIRRPGAALFVEMVAALVEMAIGSYWGPMVLVSGLMQGLGVEIAVAIFAWRRFNLGVAVLGGALAAVLEVVAWEWWFYWADWAWSWKLAYLGAFSLSGALIAGLGGYALVQALARAGALRSFPAGAEARLARARA